MISKRRLLLSAAATVAAVAAPTLGLALRGPDGLLAGLIVTHVALMLVLLRVWISIDGTVSQARLRLTRDVRDLSRRTQHDLGRVLDKLGPQDLEQWSRALVQQVQAEAEALASRLLEHERQISQLHEETLRQLERGFEVQKEDARHLHHAAAVSISQKLHVEYAQFEALLALYHDLQPPTALPATRSWVASPDLLRYVYDHIRHEQPHRILECGSGLSTVVMAYAIRAAGYDGRIVSLEHLEEYADQTRHILAEHGVADFVDVRLAPLVDVQLEGEVWPWYDQQQLPTNSIDLLFIDGPPGATRHQARYPALPLLRELLQPGAVVILDDYSRQEEEEVVNRWLADSTDLGVTRLRHEKGTAVLRILPEDHSLPQDTAHAVLRQGDSPSS